MPANEPLIPARLAYSAGGTPYSESFDDIYHSADGGLQQARHVFLGGNDLPARWQGRPRFTILETGFGLGLNFLATWAAWRDDPLRPTRLDYLSIEKHPFSANDLASLHAGWPELATYSAALRSCWPILTPGFHRLYLDEGRVCLTLLFGDAQRLLPQLQAKVDAIYLDGFAPTKNPDLWCESIYRPLARLCHADTTLASYTVASTVRDGLSHAGFATEKRKGFGRKREMLSARFVVPDIKPRIGSSAARDRHAIVIGAGVAGCAVSERLAARGWQVSLVERHAAPAQEASGNLAGIVRPMLSLDDNIASRLSRACFLFAGRHWQSLVAQGLPLRWFPNGVLHLARDAAHENLQRQIVDTRRFPSVYSRFLSADEASALLNWPVTRGGWLFPGGGHANPASLCQAYLQRFPDRIARLFMREALSLRHIDSGWQVCDWRGQVLAQAETLILASGAEAKRFEQTQNLPIRRIRGQVTHIPAGDMPALKLALTREGYATPALDGWHCVGASYELEENPDLTVASSQSNLARLEQMLPGSLRDIDASLLGGRVATRAAATDRLPLIGALPDPMAPIAPHASRLSEMPRLPGLYGLLGLGSRGLVWHALAAELLAAQLEDEPLPLEADLIAAADPARFLLRRYRRGDR